MPSTRNKNRLPTAKERLFVHHYSADPEGGIGRALRAAGYTENFVHKSSKKIMANPVVQRLLSEATAVIFAKLDVTREKIIRRVAEKFFANDATASEVSRLGKLLAEMTPGALVPINVNHSVGMSLEDFLKEKDATTTSPTPGGAELTH